MEIYRAITNNSLTTPLLFFAYAKRQFAAGDKSWVNYLMTKNEAKVRDVLRVAHLLNTAASTVAFQAMSHLAILQSAAAHECVCNGQAVAAWEQILTLNGIDVGQYCSSVYALFANGGGKGRSREFIRHTSSQPVRGI